MPFQISTKTFKQQTKLIAKSWPFAQKATTMHIRKVLSQVYGYRNDHHYHKLMHQTTTAKDRQTAHQATSQHSTSQKVPLATQSTLPANMLTPCSKEAVIQNYPLWVKRLASLAPMNEIQAKKLMYQVWIGYLKDHIDTEAKMYACSFTFFGDCEVFLDESLRGAVVPYRFDDKPSVKDAIEAMGIPHTEVLAIRVNTGAKAQAKPEVSETISPFNDVNEGAFVDFSYKLSNGDAIEVFSNPDYLQVCQKYGDEAQRLPYKPQNLTFLLDVHLGGLARYLRMAGFDCLYDTKDYGDAFLAQLSHDQDLVLLTRDINLLKRGKVKYGRWIRNVLPEQQFHEVLHHYQLFDEFKPFSICIKCNGSIEAVATDAVKDQVPAGVLEQNLDFKQCQTCQQVYWQGSHFDKIQDILAKARATSGMGA